MAANLFGERFVGVRQPAWHGLGQVFDREITAEEAVKAAGLGYKITKQPLYAEFPGIQGFGVMKVDTGKWGIFREPTNDDPEYRFFGAASEDYAIVQNEQIAQILEPLTKIWPVETAGALGMGETIFLSLSAGDAEIHGEPVKQYFLVTDTRDGGTSLKIAFTPVRVVCQNTLVSGLKQATVSSALSHNPGVEKVLTARVNLLEKMQEAQASTMATFEQLASAAITDNDAQTIFAAAYPMPTKSVKIDLLTEFNETTGPEQLGALYDEATLAQSNFLYYVNRAQTFRDGVFQTYQKLNDEHNSIARTPWAAYNAVVEFADFREGAQSLEISALFGARASEKKRAFASAVNFIK